MLVNPKAYLIRARREGWAMGGFNVFDLESARAVIDAGEDLAAPLLVQTSEGAVKHAGLEEHGGDRPPLRPPTYVHLGRAQRGGR